MYSTFADKNKARKSIVDQIFLVTYRFSFKKFLYKCQSTVAFNIGGPLFGKRSNRPFAPEYSYHGIRSIKRTHWRQKSRSFLFSPSHHPSCPAISPKRLLGTSQGSLRVCQNVLLLIVCFCSAFRGVSTVAYYATARPQWSDVKHRRNKTTKNLETIWNRKTMGSKQRGNLTRFYPVMPRTTPYSATHLLFSSKIILATNFPFSISNSNFCPELNNG